MDKSEEFQTTRENHFIAYAERIGSEVLVRDCGMTVGTDELWKVPTKSLMIEEGVQYYAKVSIFPWSDYDPYRTDDTPVKMERVNRKNIRFEFHAEPKPVKDFHGKSAVGMWTDGFGVYFDQGTPWSRGLSGMCFVRVELMEL